MTKGISHDRPVTITKQITHDHPHVTNKDKDNQPHEYTPQTTRINDNNFRPLFRNCLDRLSASNPHACDHVSDWDVSGLTNCSHFFWKPTYDGMSDWMLMSPGAELFNVDISRWQLTSCTTFKGMFLGASQFNQPLQNWDTSKVTDMSQMFQGAQAFDQDLSSFQTDRVTDMSSMFRYASEFQGLGLDTWNVSSVQTMESAFQDASSVEANGIGAWNVSSVSSFQSMFEGTVSFNQPIGNWDVGAATSLKSMFRNAHSFNQGLTSWDIHHVTEFTGIFHNAKSYSQSLCWGDYLNSNVTRKQQVLEGTFGNVKLSCTGMNTHTQRTKWILGTLMALVSCCLIVCVIFYRWMHSSAPLDSNNNNKLEQKHSIQSAMKRRRKRFKKRGQEDEESGEEEILFDEENDDKTAVFPSFEEDENDERSQHSDCVSFVDETDMPKRSHKTKSQFTLGDLMFLDGDAWNEMMGRIRGQTKSYNYEDDDDCKTGTWC